MEHISSIIRTSSDIDEPAQIETVDTSPPPPQQQVEIETSKPHLRRSKSIPSLFRFSDTQPPIAISFDPAPIIETVQLVLDQCDDGPQSVTYQIANWIENDRESIPDEDGVGVAAAVDDDRCPVHDHHQRLRPIAESTGRPKYADTDETNSETFRHSFRSTSTSSESYIDERCSTPLPPNEDLIQVCDDILRQQIGDCVVIDRQLLNELCGTIIQQDIERTNMRYNERAIDVAEDREPDLEADEIARQRSLQLESSIERSEDRVADEQEEIQVEPVEPDEPSGDGEEQAVEETAVESGDKRSGEDQKSSATVAIDDVDLAAFPFRCLRCEFKSPTPNELKEHEKNAHPDWTRFNWKVRKFKTKILKSLKNPGMMNYGKI